MKKVFKAFSIGDQKADPGRQNWLDVLSISVLLAHANHEHLLVEIPSTGYLEPVTAESLARSLIELSFTLHKNSQGLNSPAQPSIEAIVSRTARIGLYYC